MPRAGVYFAPCSRQLNLSDMPLICSVVVGNVVRTCHVLLGDEVLNCECVDHAFRQSQQMLAVFFHNAVLRQV